MRLVSWTFIAGGLLGMGIFAWGGLAGVLVFPYVLAGVSVSLLCVASGIWQRFLVELLDGLLTAKLARRKRK